MNRSLYPQLNFDPVRDLEPVSLTSWGQLILVTHPRSGFATGGDLIAAARKAPGKLNYASPGVGTPHHLSMELFKNTAKVFLTHIPYRGTGPAVTDMLGGQVDAMFLPIHVALPQVRSGKLLALGIGSDKRHPLLPDVPTLSEAKAGDVNVDMRYGIFAPKGMPASQVASLNREINDILRSEDVKKAFAGQGMDPASDAPEAFGRLVARDADRWATLIKTQGIKAE
jgi:tripartite-type tricarboxylate transporter receptor subunit TctC